MNGPYSNDVKEFTIDPGCPWYEAQQSYGAPNVNWCEPTVCSIINEPANTWSNLPYMIIGLVLVKKMKDDAISGFPYVVFFMGLFSFIYHASNNYLTQFLDFVGMFLMMGILLAFNFRRVFPKFKFGTYSLFWFFVFLNTAGFMAFNIIDFPVQPMMLINAVPIIILDLTAGYKEGRLKDYSLFGATVFFLIAAQSFAILDIKRIWCEPENTILHGHVVWHILGSVAMLCAGLHLKRMTR